MSKGKSFWKTLPGVITGLAAIITAVAGLIVAINGAGLFNKSSGGDKVLTETTKEFKKEADSLVIRKELPQKEVSQYKAVLSMTEVKTAVYEYKVLDTSFEPMTPVSSSLKIKIRFTNNSNYPANFWNSRFRIAIDSVLTAPVGELNEVVDTHAALVGMVIFEVPNNVRDLVFHIYDGERDIAIPVKIALN